MADFYSCTSSLASNICVLLFFLFYFSRSKYVKVNKPTSVKLILSFIKCFILFMQFCPTQWPFSICNIDQKPSKLRKSKQRTFSFCYLLHQLLCFDHTC